MPPVELLQDSSSTGFSLWNLVHARTNLKNSRQCGSFVHERRREPFRSEVNHVEESLGPPSSERAE